jgi:hypothetical protein
VEEAKQLSGGIRSVPVRVAVGAPSTSALGRYVLTLRSLIRERCGQGCVFDMMAAFLVGSARRCITTQPIGAPLSRHVPYLPLPAGKTCLMDLLPLDGKSARVVPHKLDHGSGSGMGGAQKKEKRGNVPTRMPLLRRGIIYSGRR